jgi:propionyl-CoA synthetase
MNNSSAFWQQASKAITWDCEPEQILDASKAPFYRWFAGGKMNTCFNAIDRHVLAGRGQQVALHYVSPMTGAEQHISYQFIQTQVERLAGLLVSLGVTKGDRVVIYCLWCQKRPLLCWPVPELARFTLWFLVVLPLMN